MQTVADFAEACKTLVNDEVYELFENGISQKLREQIYYVYEDYETCEPTRAALNAIGAKYNVQSLIDY